MDRFAVVCTTGILEPPPSAEGLLVNDITVYVPGVRPEAVDAALGTICSPPAGEKLNVGAYRWFEHGVICQLAEELDGPAVDIFGLNALKAGWRLVEAFHQRGLPSASIDESDLFV